VIGHQIEEGLLRDLRNPSHRDRGLAVVLPAVSVWLIGGALIAAGGFGATAPLAAALVVLVLGLLAGVAGSWMANRAAARRQSQAAAAAREQDVARSRRGIEEARRRGDFDRWENSGSSGSVG
jgi:hypothetical protein